MFFHRTERQKMAFTYDASSKRWRKFSQVNCPRESPDVELSLMARTSQAPATKQDISLLMERMGDLEQGNHSLRLEIQEWKTEVIHEFHIVAEDMRHDAFGIQKDRIADHEHRITRLERQSRVKA